MQAQEFRLGNILPYARQHSLPLAQFAVALATLELDRLAVNRLPQLRFEIGIRIENIR
jgi:hypothetical protein